MGLRRPATARPTPEPASIARQLAHDHGKAYDAIEIAAQRLEMLPELSHGREVGLLRAIRRRLNQHIIEGHCDGE